MPGGWADPGDYGYFPHSAWYVEQCAAPPPPPTYTCPHCGETFSTQAELDDHIAVQHPPPPPPETLKCPLCEYDLGIVGLRVEVIEPGFTTETVTHACGAKIQYQVSSVAAQNVALVCPYDGASLGVKGLSGTAVITNIDEMASKLQGEIATLNGKIAELQDRIEALEAQVAEAREIIGG